MATEQRINQPMRQQQEANQLQQAIALQEPVTAQQDAAKALFQAASNYGQNYDTSITPAITGGGAAAALNY